MPARKTHPKTKRKIIHKSIGLRGAERFSSPDSYKSLSYGILTVVILFVIGFSAVKFFITHPKPEIDNGAVSITNVEKVTQLQKQANSQETKTYTVKPGESLWDIAVAEYHDGYKWTEIARVNKIANPDTIFKNDKLVIPQVTETPTLVSPSSINGQTSQAPFVSSTDKITGTTYIVKHGDDLWNIATRAYGDGYKWVDIARANNLSDPGLIFSDNVLKLPR